MANQPLYVIAYLATKSTEFGEIMQNNGHYAVQVIQNHRFWYQPTSY